MPRISPLQVSLGVGVAGAMVDVSADVAFVEGFVIGEGRQDQFRDTEPGTFTFTLDNYDGKYTPDNASSSLATKLTERTPVCVNVGGKLRLFRVQGVSFGADEANWGRLTVTADDMLGDASRTHADGLAVGMVAATSPSYFWKLDDSSDALGGADSSGNNGPAIMPLGTASGIEFGGAGIPGVSSGSLQITTTLHDRYVGAPISAASGAYGVWVTPAATNTAFIFTVTWGSIGNLTQYPVVIAPDGNGRITFTGMGVTIVGPTFTAGVPIYLAYTASFLTSSTIALNFYVNGVSVGTGTGGVVATPVSSARSVSLGITSASDSATFSNLYIGPTLVHQESALEGVNIATRLAGIVSTTAGIAINTLPTDLSTAPLGSGNDGTQSALEALNDVIRTEQGYIYTKTTGTLLNPTSALTVRARQRPATVSYNFDANAELSNAVQFVRDLTNLVSTVTVTGPNATATTTTTDATILARAGSANASETVVLANSSDLCTYGSDRIWRGSNGLLRVTSIKIDALTTPTDRSADLLNMAQGDRIRITNLPTAPLGFTTWDGWLIGRTETHTLTQHEFELFLQPCTPTSAIYDTNRYMAGGALFLNGAITAAATTMPVATNNSTTLLSTTETPYTLLIDKEQVTVTACTTGTPQVVTITRGVNGTTAAAHNANAQVELATQSLFAY